MTNAHLIGLVILLLAFALVVLFPADADARHARPVEDDEL